MFFVSFIVSFIAGALLPLAFAPVGWAGMAMISPLILLFLLENASAKQALWRGFLYGLGFFGFGAYWIFISINTYGNTNIFISSVITLGFISILASYFSLFAWTYIRASQAPPFRSEKEIVPSFKKGITFSTLWVIFEWIRSWFLTGFPWLLVGQSQTETMLSGYAPVIGVYGMSFLTVFTSVIAYNLLKNTRTFLNIFLFGAIWLGGYLLTFVHWTHPISQPFSVTLIQGNIPEMTKWDPQQAVKSLQTYQDFSTQHWDSKIIIWPETAITFLYSQATPFIQRMDHSANKHQTAIITGIPVDQNNQYYNAAIAVGAGHGIYFKRHLVPFGEYIPLEKYLRGLIGFLNLPMSSFSAGPQVQHLLTVQGMSVAPFICYEIAYSHLLRTDLPRANLLVTMSNDSWFGQSEALSQHLQIAQLSAEMAQRYMLVATNSGKTAVISPKGKILATAPIDQPAFITASVQAMAGTTPWIQFGNMPILFLMLVGLIICRKKS